MTTTPVERERAVRVSGRGEVTVAPDTAVIDLGVNVTDASTETALRWSNETITRVTAALTGAGIAKDDVTLGRFSVRTVYDHVEGRQVLRGYQVRHGLSVKVRDLERVGAVLSMAVSAGATEVQSVRFSVEDPTSATDRARERAFDDALHKAEELARLAGVSLGANSSISETSFAPVPVERHAMRAMAAEMSSIPDVPVNPEDLTFTITLDVAWDLQ